MQEVKLFSRGKLTQEQFVELVNREIKFNEVSHPIQWMLTGSEVSSAIISYDSERAEPPVEDEEEEVLVAAVPVSGRKARSGGRNPIVEGFENEG